jgi:hypothetical protein
MTLPAWARTAIVLVAGALVVASETEAEADVSAPFPGVTLVRHAGSAMTIANLCASGVSVRATKFAERRATPQQWAEGVGAQVAINADFFDFPGWSYILVRARGDGEDWPAGAQQLLQPSSYWKFGSGIADIEASSLVPPAPGVTNVVGAYDPLIENGQIHDFTGEPFMLASYRRSAIGLSADHGTLYFYASNVAINGPGMAAEMIAMAAEGGGAPIAVATNEDGGGSSQLYVQGMGQVIDSGRQVNTHLGIYASGQGAPTHCASRTNRANASAAAWSPSRLDLFIQGDDDALHHQSWGGTWSPWEPLGGKLLTQPVVASWGANRLDSFAVAADKSLTHTAWTGTGWATDALGGVLSSAPAVTSWGPNRLDVFATADDRSLSHWAWSGTAWTNDSLGGQLTTSPAVTAWAPNRLDVFAAGADKALNHKWWDGTSFSGWEVLAGEPLASPPAVASWGPNRLDVFALANDGSLSHWSWNGAAWGHDALGGQLASPPAVATWGNNRLDVFGVGNDHALYHRPWGGTAWQPWENLGGQLDPASAPTAVAWGPNRLDVFAAGTDRALWHKWWDGATWSGWESRGGKIKAKNVEAGNGMLPDGGIAPNQDGSADGGVASDENGSDGLGDSSGDSCSTTTPRTRRPGGWVLVIGVASLLLVRRRRRSA